MLETILFVVSVTLVIVSVRLYEATTEIKRLNKRRDATVADILDQKPPHPRSHSPGSSF